MKVLITGVAGFIGSHLGEALIENGFDIIGVDSFSDYYPRTYKEKNIENLLGHKNFIFIEGDLLEIPLSFLSEIDYCFHQSAQPGVRRSWDMFSVYVKDNILATQRLLDEVKKYPIKKFIYASSSSVYGDASLPLNEEAKPSPVSPYGTTKLCAENMVELYRKSYGFPTVSLRYFTVYGPRQRPDMAFFKFIKGGLLGETITVFGDGGQTRDFTFVSDIVRANVLAAESSAVGIFNIGGGHRITVNEAISLIEDVIGKKLKVEYISTQKGDMHDTLADIEKAKKELSFNPQGNLKNGLLLEAEWIEKQIGQVYT
ncbi:TPA: UDP-glucose 4-epimerase [bacterium]|nr:UDP-glucose 4-epimerase [bacterium]